jgi:hypothetical protein
MPRPSPATYSSGTKRCALDAYLDKIEEWVERSQGDIRADVCNRKLIAMGYAGSERTTRRAVALANAMYARGHRRVFRP